MELVELSTESGLFETSTTNNTTSTDNEDELPLWLMVFNKIQLTFAIAGALMNISTFVALNKAGSLNRMVSFLMKHQALLDFFVCLFYGIIRQQPLMWGTGIQIIDIIVCYVWHSNVLAWLCFLLSVWSLILLSFDRFLAICKPFIYMNMTKSKMILYISIIYIWNIGISIPISIYIVEFNNGQCEQEFKLGFMRYYAIFLSISSYLAPCVLIVILYGKIVLSLRKRQRDGHNLGRSAVIDVATKQLTKSAAIVTTIFILTLGTTSVMMPLSILGAVELTVNSPLTKIDDFLNVLNSCANPVVYLCVLPSYRQEVIKLFQRTRRESHPTVDSTETSYI